jgi:DNA-binding NtrC family response regulator
VLPIEVPPLRDRRDDIERLVNHFLKLSGGDGPVDPQLMRQLADRPWRGNVRELRNFVDRARALGAKEALAMSSQGQASAAAPEPIAAPEPVLPKRPPSTSSLAEPGSTSKLDDPKVFDATYKDFREAWIDAGEKEYVKRLLVRHDRNVAAAAREAGVDRTYIYRLIRKHEL